MKLFLFILSLFSFIEKGTYSIHKPKKDKEIISNEAYSFVLNPKSKLEKMTWVNNEIVHYEEFIEKVAHNKII